MNRAMRALRSGIVRGARKVKLDHKYWRLRFTGTNHTATAKYVSPAEIQFRPTVGVAVTNMAALGTPSASSTFSPPTYSADKAIDNNAGTAWICAQDQWNNSWWKMNFTTPQAIKQVMLQAFNTVPGAQQMPSGFVLEWSDNDTVWNGVLTVTGATAWGASEVRTFNVP